MKSATMTLLLLLLLTPTDTAEDGAILIFILAGQSNAAGYGVKWEAARALHGPALPGTILHYCQGSPSRPRCSSGWVPLSGTGNRLPPSPGSELAIGAAVHNYSQLPVGIIKVTFNGTGLAQSNKPDWNTGSAELFQILLERIRLAVQELPSHLGARLAGFFWLQGESDALEGPDQPNQANGYERNLNDLIRQVRLELRQPELPVVIARISPPESTRNGRLFSYRHTVREAQSRLARGNRKIAQVNTDDLPRQEDDLHFTEKGQSILGRRFVEAWLKLTSSH